MTTEYTSADITGTEDYWAHAVIILSSVVMIATLLKPNTHLDPTVWMAWFLPFIMIIQAYILIGFARLS